MRACVCLRACLRSLLLSPVSRARFVVRFYRVLRARVINSAGFEEKTFVLFFLAYLSISELGGSEGSDGESSGLDGGGTGQNEIGFAHLGAFTEFDFDVQVGITFTLIA